MKTFLMPVRNCPGIYRISPFIRTVDEPRTTTAAVAQTQLRHQERQT